MDLMCRVLGRFAEGATQDDEPITDFEQLSQNLNIARQSKLDKLFLKALGLQSNYVPLDGAADVSKIVKKNADILHITAKSSALLSSQNIPHVFFKGPIQQKLLYGDFFARPAHDADLLVSREDFKRACESLTRAGFVSPEQFSRLWWCEFLGERPFFFSSFASPPIDIHNRMQQPGAPAPRALERFFRGGHSIKLGPTDIPTLGLPMVVIVSAINIVKAIYHREPAGGHGLDIVTALKSMSEEEIELTRQEARIQGMQNTVRFASRIAAVTFFAEDRFFRGALNLPIATHDMRAYLIDPSSVTGPFLKRRTMLAWLCDNIWLDFPIEAARWVVSEGARVLAERK